MWSCGILCVGIYLTSNLVLSFIKYPQFHSLQKFNLNSAQFNADKNRILIIAMSSSINEPNSNINSTKSNVFDKRGQKLLNAAKKLRDEADRLIINQNNTFQSSSINNDFIDTNTNLTRIMQLQNTVTSSKFANVVDKKNITIKVNTEKTEKINEVDLNDLNNLSSSARSNDSEFDEYYEDRTVDPSAAKLKEFSQTLESIKLPFSGLFSNSNPSSTTDNNSKTNNNNTNKSKILPKSSSSGLNNNDIASPMNDDLKKILSNLEIPNAFARKYLNNNQIKMYFVDDYKLLDVKPNLEVLHDTLAKVSNMGWGISMVYKPVLKAVCQDLATRLGVPNDSELFEAAWLIEVSLFILIINVKLLND